MKRLMLIICMLTLSNLAYATIDAYDFKNSQDEQRFRELTKELRCPKCQNNDIADSNAGLAKDIKDRAYQLIGEGKSNKEIVAYMVDRYGDFITYRPPMRPVTWFLWFGPFVLAIVAAAVVFGRKLGQKSGDTVEVTPEQHAKVQELLKQLDQSEKNP